MRRRVGSCLVRSVGGPSATHQACCIRCPRRGMDASTSCSAPSPTIEVCRELDRPMLVSLLRGSGQQVHCVRQDVSRCRADMPGAKRIAALAQSVRRRCASHDDMSFFPRNGQQPPECLPEAACNLSLELCAVVIHAHVHSHSASGLVCAGPDHQAG